MRRLVTALVLAVITRALASVAAIAFLRFYLWINTRKRTQEAPCSANG